MASSANVRQSIQMLFKRKADVCAVSNNWQCNRWLLLRFDCLGALATFISMNMALFWASQAAPFLRA